MKFIYLIAPALLIFSGCSTKYILNENLPPLPEPEQEVIAPRVGLVLGAGGARGMAHIGVLYELEKANVPIDLIVGCSAGSIVGAMYADTPDAEALYENMRHLTHSDLIYFSFRSLRYGPVLGKKLLAHMTKAMKGQHFYDLEIPLVIVTTDLLNGERVSLRGGKVAPAAHASAAIPGYFHPVELYGRIFVDGAVTSPMPTDIAKELGAKLVIAVDISEYLPKSLPAHLFGVGQRSLEILYHHHTEQELKNADIVIRPKVGDVGVMDDSKMEHLYEAGREAAREKIPEILENLRKIPIALQKSA